MDYDFLNNYISKIMDTSDSVDEDTNVDEDGFFSDNSEEGDDDADGLHYGTDSDEGARLAYEYLDDDETENSDGPNDGGPDGEYEEESPYGIPSYAKITGNYDFKDTPSGEDDITKAIVKNESQGKYSALNTSGGGQGAVGKYQFRWNIWKDDIGKITGVKDRDAFRNNPKAQEKFYSWYEKNYLLPAANDLQPYNAKRLTKSQLAELIHFRGKKGAREYLLGQASDKPESYNMSTSGYIGMKQRGGAVGIAMSPGAQHMGLNHPSFDSMIFPMEGINTFRGLDDGSEVLLEDETGKKKKLKGRKHKTKMTGTVYETRTK